MGTDFHRLHRDLDHRSNQGRRHTVSGHVRHQEPNPLSIRRNEFIEITSHRGHRPIRHSNPEVLDFRNGGGEDGEPQLSALSEKDRGMLT
jgi:hypothetical protein